MKNTINKAEVQKTMPLTEKKILRNGSPISTYTFFDDKVCANCRYYDHVHGCCSDGTPTSRSGWCSSFSY